MKNIALFTSDIFLSNKNNGIYTFIKNINYLFKNSYNIVVVATNKIDTNNFPFFVTNDIKLLKNSDLVIINCLESLKKYINLNIKKNHIFVTHMPDILNDNSETLNLLINNKDIVIATLSYNLKKFLKHKLKNKVIKLSLPCVKKDIIFKNKTNNILIISSQEKRKNYELMLRSLSYQDNKIKIICQKTIDLISLVKKNNIKYEILSNINNDIIPTIIYNSKLLIHMSESEVYPYSILESLAYNIPVILNKNSIWCKCFDDYDGCYKINPTTEDILLTINHVEKINNKIDNSNIFSKNLLEWKNFFNMVIK